MAEKKTRMRNGVTPGGRSYVSTRFADGRKHTKTVGPRWSGKPGTETYSKITDPETKLKSVAKKNSFISKTAHGLSAKKISSSAPYKHGPKTPVKKKAK